MYGHLHQGQRSGCRFRIRIAGELSYYRPGSHLHRERNQQENTSHQSGVERITSQTSKCHFSHTDRYQRTDDDNPQRQVGRQVECQQHPRQRGRTIGNRGTFTLQDIFGDSPFKEQAGYDRSQCHHHCSQAEHVERYEQGRYQRNQHAIHVFLYTVATMYMRR